MEKARCTVRPGEWLNTRGVCHVCTQETNATNATIIPIVIYRLIHSDVILELSERIKVLDCQEMGFF